jgi:hypothetical protein
MYRFGHLTAHCICGGRPLLWQTPDELSVRKLEGEETADRWLTGIVEVQLPMDYKLKNIEETERAKNKMLEKTRRGLTP